MTSDASPTSVLHSIALIILTCFPTKVASANCGFPGRPGHGFFSPVRTIFNPGAIINYTCEQKYYLLGPPSRQCTEQGEWTGSLPFCVEETPLPLVMTMNPPCKPQQRMIDKDDETCVTISSADVISWEITLTDIKTILSVIITVQIDADSSAEGLKVFVKPISQNIPEATKPECNNRTFKGRKETIRQEFSSSTKGRYLYISDTQRQLKRIRICEIHVITKEHTKFDCGEPESLFHSMLTRESRQLVKYVCDEGYVVLGTATRTCDQNGVWSGKPPRCVIQNETEFSSSTTSSQNLFSDCDDGNCETTSNWLLTTTFISQPTRHQDKSDTNMYVYVGTFVNVLLFLGIVGLALYVYRTRISQGTRSNTAHLDMLSNNGYSPCQSADGMFTTAIYHTYEDISNNEVLVVPVPQRTSRLPSCSTRRSVNSTRCSDFRRTPPEIPTVPPDNPRKSGDTSTSGPGSRDSYPATTTEPVHIYAEIYENDVTLPIGNRRGSTSVCSSVATVPISPTRESIASVGLAETIFKSLSNRPESQVFSKEEGCPNVTLSPVYAQPADETQEESHEGKVGYIYTLPYGTKETIAVG